MDEGQTLEQGQKKPHEQTCMEPIVAVQLTEGTLNSARSSMSAWAGNSIAGVLGGDESVPGSLCKAEHPVMPVEMSGYRKAKVFLPPACNPWEEMKRDLGDMYGYDDATEQLAGTTAVLLNVSEALVIKTPIDSATAPVVHPRLLEQVFVGNLRDSDAIDLLAWALRMWALVQPREQPPPP